MNDVNLNIIDHISYFSETRKNQHIEKMKKLVEETEVMLKKMYLVRISQRRKKIIEKIWKK
jgi:hypothetical protein